MDSWPNCIVPDCPYKADTPRYLKCYKHARGISIQTENEYYGDFQAHNEINTTSSQEKLKDSPRK